MQMIWFDCFNFVVKKSRNKNKSLKLVQEVDAEEKNTQNLKYKLCFAFV